MTLESQYKQFIEQTPEKAHWTYQEWLEWHSDKLGESIKNINSMAKKKEENYLEAIEGNVAAAIRLAKAEYEKKPSNPMHSVITNLELTLREIKKWNNILT